MYQLTLPEGADEALQRLLDRETWCPRHVGTTLDGFECELCRIEQLPQRQAAELHRPYREGLRAW
jgi:hypothetical protein